MRQAFRGVPRLARLTGSSPAESLEPRNFGRSLNRAARAGHNGLYVRPLLFIGRTVKSALLAAPTATSQVVSMDQKLMSSTTQQSLTDVRFDSFPLSKETLRALEEMEYALCTKVQAAALPVCVGDVDIVCKAKTGTGKTLAFLIPAVERLRRGSRGIQILIISPTRELAHQIATEAEKLAFSHGLRVQCVVGGTNVRSDQAQLTRSAPEILVATPGRLNDLLDSTTGLQARLAGLQSLVFDEGDRLLDMGFRPAIDKILSRLPSKKQRQTMLFSATYPPDIQSLTRFALREQFQLIDTVGQTEHQTAEQVEQSLIITSMQRQVADLLHVLRQHISTEKRYKVMVFFTTARLTEMYAHLFQNLGLSVLEMHSRKSQSHRTHVADQFRSSERVVLFSSDVSARGVDYPDVTLVAQVGSPESRDQYIHRVGRTARAGKAGQAVLLLEDFEESFARKLGGLPLQRVTGLTEQDALQYSGSIASAIASIPDAMINHAYQAWLGYYKSKQALTKWSAVDVVANANMFAKIVLGCAEPPAIRKSTVGKMGLSKTPGLRTIGGNELPPPKRAGNRHHTKPESVLLGAGMMPPGELAGSAAKTGKKRSRGQRAKSGAQEGPSTGGQQPRVYDELDW